MLRAPVLPLLLVACSFSAEGLGSETGTTSSTSTSSASASAPTTTATMATATMASETMVLTTTASETTTGDPGPSLTIEGLGVFPTGCFSVDCGAKQACETVSGGMCTWVPYDFPNLNVGSYVPLGYEAKPEMFAFGLYTLKNDVGNISSCKPEAEAKAFLASFGLFAGHKYCGLGNWHF